MAIYCVKCGARHECSVCPVCAGFGLSNLRAPAGVGKSFQQADELRAKFAAWWDSDEDIPTFNCRPDSPLRWAMAGWYAAYASRDAEVEALKRDAERYRWLRKNHNADLLAQDVIDEAIDHD